jgi:inorganic triphosphatase YgiF
MSTEIEAKFLAADRGPLEALAAATEVGEAALGELRAFDEIDRYLDTEEGLLAEQRWACRLRNRHGAWIVSLKGPRSLGESAWIHSRPELEGPALETLEPADWPPSGARDQLALLSAGRPLVERLRLLQHRSERPVSMHGEPMATLSLDEVRVEREGQALGTFLSVELELTEGGPAANLPPLAEILRGVSGLTADPRSKLEHALALSQAALETDHGHG